MMHFVHVWGIADAISSIYVYSSMGSHEKACISCRIVSRTFLRVKIVNVMIILILSFWMKLELLLKHSVRFHRCQNLLPLHHLPLKLLHHHLFLLLLLLPLFLFQFLKLCFNEIVSASSQWVIFQRSFLH